MPKDECCVCMITHAKRSMTLTSTLLAWVWLASDMQSSWVSLCQNTFASLLIFSSVSIWTPKPVPRAGESMRLTDDAQRCWEHFWCGLVSYPTLYSGRVLAYRVGYESRCRSLHIGDQGSWGRPTKGLSHGKYSELLRKFCSKGFQWMEDIYHEKTVWKKRLPETVT